MPTVDDRGRVDDAASFGSDAPPLRELLCGVPDARFLPHMSQNTTQSTEEHAPFLDDICLQRQRTHDAVQFLYRRELR